MKNPGFFALCILLVVAACSTPPSGDQAPKGDTLMISNQVYSLDSIDFKEFQSIKADSYQDNEKEVINDSSVHRTDSLTLTFQLKNGKTLNLKNDTSESNFITYNYIETMPDINAWFLRETYYEGGGYLLIDRQTGEKTEIYGRPCLSKNKLWFFTYSFDIEAGFIDNGIQLFNVENGKPRHVWTKEITSWGPSIVKWSSDSCVYIEKSQIVPNNTDSGLTLSYKKMKIVK